MTERNRAIIFPTKVSSKVRRQQEVLSTSPQHVLQDAVKQPHGFQDLVLQDLHRPPFAILKVPLVRRGGLSSDVTGGDVGRAYDSRRRYVRHRRPAEERIYCMKSRWTKRTEEFVVGPI